jgi:hypothetical protein
MNDIIRQMREIIGGKPSIRDAALLAGLDALEAEIAALHCQYGVAHCDASHYAAVNAELRQRAEAAESTIATCKASDNPHDHARLFHEWRDEISEARRMQRIAEMERDELRAIVERVAEERGEDGVLVAEAPLPDDLKPGDILPAHMRRQIQRAREEAKHGLQLNDGLERVMLSYGVFDRLLMLAEWVEKQEMKQ